MDEESDQFLPEIVSKAIKLPGVKVDRRAFLAKTFHQLEGAELAQLVDQGPQSLFGAKDLIKVANRVVLNDTEKSTVFSFAAGLPSTPLAMAGTATADILQYFAFAVRMAQEVAYVFGRPSIFNEDGALTEAGEREVMLYLGAMLGVAAANSGLMLVSRGLGATVGKKMLQATLTKTFWYPLMKKIAGAIGIQVTKKSASSLVTKTVPIIGGIASGGLTFLTFRPMGKRLVKVFSETLQADDQQIIDAENVVVSVE
ncbi:hypothetical protein [Oenococcus kitaharae]|uniref:EcsC family protein n=1 Tax=Oenococcus kitaharae DSM 17330 TaxID=1045004 RepID=G9WIP0_9LACO|nr:hypothetical protein [Oenococcus kitaharae]EHN58179.1 hypothetical protein OKIT_0050 [Oenococcus kitaharae DSM 17330]